MNFYEIRERSTRKGGREIYPEFVLCRNSDLMIRGKAFYAIWDEEKGLWSTDEHDVATLVDKDLYSYLDKLIPGDPVKVCTMRQIGEKSSWLQYRKYVSNVPDDYHQLDDHLTFSDTVVKKEDYASKRLPYPLQKGPCEAYEQIMSTLYDPDERKKLEWAIGSIVSGDSRDIQKFVVLYGAPGAGKGTILEIIKKLFVGYCSTFDAKALTSQANAFSTEVFRSNPLVAIQTDGNLSRIEDNSKLNTIVSHEDITVNEKFKAQYTLQMHCMLFMATNQPVMITDAKSGLIRRLIDVSPSGRRIPPKTYRTLMNQIDFELGAIASHCLDIYNEAGRDAYNTYVPMNMIYQTDIFFNFVEQYIDKLSDPDGISLSRAYDLYSEYHSVALDGYKKLARHKFREELKNYFENFYEVTRVDGKQVRSWYTGFLKDKFSGVLPDISDERSESWLVLDKTESLFDVIFADCPAQYTSMRGGPLYPWADCATSLKDISTGEVHYVKVPENLVVVDFDIRDAEGNKSKEKNLAAASKWPKTYAEFSKSGGGVHLHYFYDGDVTRLDRVYDDGIEVKIFTGGSALRRKLTFCNDIPIATINSGLPLKKEEPVIDQKVIKSEKKLRELILRNINKEIHPGTKPSIDFIAKILDDAYASGLKYDVSDMRQRIFVFAMNSTNQSDYCMKKVGEMKFRSETASGPVDISDDVVFFDVEVFPNMNLVCWKYAGSDKEVVSMFNPTPKDIEVLMSMPLVGFNNRRYDNHILYAIYLGYSPEQVYEVSMRLVNNEKNAGFGEAYNISKTDVYDFVSKKQSLKKYEIELGQHHQELGIRWDQPVPKDMWETVAKYCGNDVRATEAVWNARQSDWKAREILADLSGLTVNDTTNSHTTRFIFGDDRKPQIQFNYRFLGGPLRDGETYSVPDGADPEWSLFEGGNKPIFPGYVFDAGKSTYRGEEVGEGGYVYAEPGIYYNVALLDIASMHPSSIVAENLFGDKYTKRFKDILDARVAIKHKDYEKARIMLDGKLARYLDDESASADLASALKIAINSVYGLTSAKFDNPFHDIRNKDNIVAKRGALFMVNLKHEVQRRGFTVAHIKTDSIKIPNATPEIIDFVTQYGRAYGYNFEHEATYERMCLVNDAVYIARYKDGKHAGEWVAVGAQFQHPYVFKKLFSHEPIGYSDMCETKSVNSSLYLDMNENLPDVSDLEKEHDRLMHDILKSKDEPYTEEIQQKCKRVDELEKDIQKGHDYQFIGKVGLFSPMMYGCGGGILVREKDGKYYAVTGTKGYRWMEAEQVELLGNQNKVDKRYYEELVTDAVKQISKYGDFDAFVDVEGGIEGDKA